MPVRGACFGFEIHSEMAFEYLRQGSGQAVRAVSSVAGETMGATEHLQTWAGIPGVRATVRLHRCGPASFGVEVGSRYWFRYDEREATFTLSPSGIPVFRETYFWGTPVAVAMARRGDLVLHAATLDVGGAGVLICGPGESGKTTLAAAFHLAGHRLLSDDLAGCRVGPEPAILPGPPLARLRLDTAERLGTEGFYVPFEEPDRVHAAVGPERRGTAEPVPLRLIVLLRREPGPFEMTPIPARGALRDLWAMSFWLPLDEDRIRCFEGLGELLSRVPVVRLARPGEWSALPETVVRIAERIP